MSFWKEAKYFPKLMYQQWRPSSMLAVIAHHRLRRLLKHAYKQVPYYRRLFDEHGIRPKDISNIDDLQKIPILTKRVLQQENPSDFVAEGVDPNQCVAIRTSGSTGLPLTVFRTKDEEIYGEMTYYPGFRKYRYISS